LEIQRKEIRNTKKQTVWILGFNRTVSRFFKLILAPSSQLELLARSTGKSVRDLENDINRPKYFNPWEAAEYGLIDQVCCLLS
jgi:ATP-dependent Clp protease protease subunit